MRTITVNGRGSVTVVPDSAIVSAATVHQAPAPAEAVAGCDSAFRAAVEVVERHLERSSISSSGVRISRHWREDLPTGYEATHSFTVRCPDLDVAGALVTDLAEAVGDRLRLHDVDLTVTDATPAVREARRLAYDDAVAVATDLAAHAGASIGLVQAIGDGRDHSGGIELMMVGAAADSSQMALEPGERTVNRSLTVTFELV